MFDLVDYEGFRVLPDDRTFRSHGRAGGDEDAKVLVIIHAALTVAFGL